MTPRGVDAANWSLLPTPIGPIWWPNRAIRHEVLAGQWLAGDILRTAFGYTELRLSQRHLSPVRPSARTYFEFNCWSM